ncbi:related to Aprataxin-like protein [Saccharomycodes ludwigii]|uniref:Related to Aprataxin-like protein n=1 Tax=Saccharomycodes ludwigii TaxID=36035 RepID=A0A376B0Z6_9ASCO|nr:hypothetical protein SCDLUD_002192 [Saccharomycodes ludwigii]KAH3902372.1 hypothetical protein SCDLUD_002192 [Saccharomycodes ludwigii]SSD58312.1 related to Aprataxin-like protein [Saccharomycodes ludwigii]
MSWKYVLKGYIVNPTSENTLFYDDSCVIIKDSFPKAKYHLLILPRDHKITIKDPKTLTFKEKSRYEKYIVWAKNYILETSKSNGGFDNNIKINDIRVGIHYVPSLANLHIHVITNDFVSDKLKYPKHYKAFNGPFFVDWDQLPLPPPYLTSKEAEMKYIKLQPLKCSHCDYPFKNLPTLKKHLKQEWETKKN